MNHLGNIQQSALPDSCAMSSLQPGPPRWEANPEETRVDIVGTSVLQERQAILAMWQQAYTSTAHTPSPWITFLEQFSASKRANPPMAAVIRVGRPEEEIKRRERFFGMVEELWQKNTHVPPKVIEHDIHEAIQATRVKVVRRSG